MLRRVDNDIWQVRNKLGIRCGGLIEFASDESNYTDESAHGNSIHSIVISDICEVISLQLGCVQFAMFKCILDGLIKVTLFAPVYDEESDLLLESKLPEKLRKFMKNWIGAIVVNLEDPFVSKTQ